MKSLIVVALLVVGCVGNAQEQPPADDPCEPGPEAAVHSHWAVSGAQIFYLSDGTYWSLHHDANHTEIRYDKSGNILCYIRNGEVVSGG